MPIEVWQKSSTGSWRNEQNLMITSPASTDTTELLMTPELSETFERLRVAAASRATLLREAHVRLEDDLRDLRSKASARH